VVESNPPNSTAQPQLIASERRKRLLIGFWIERLDFSKVAMRLRRNHCPAVVPSYFYFPMSAGLHRSKIAFVIYAILWLRSFVLAGLVASVGALTGSCEIVLYI
jgi:hypothetical protein